MTLRPNIASKAQKRRPSPWRLGAVIMAVAALTALTACGSSGGSSNHGVVSGLSGGGIYGTVPAQSGTAHSGTITVAQISGSQPTSMLPIVTSAASTTYEVYYFLYQMWKPLYWLGVGGNYATEDKSLSLADDPVWSDNDTTATITMKGTYKWSDGQPVTSQDVAFYIDELKAAIAESPANWYEYTPGVGLPDDVASVDTPNSTTLVLHLKSSVNPSWFLLDELSYVIPMPSHAWAKASASGPTLDFTNPANAKKIYNYISSQSTSGNTFASNPLWQTVDGPYKLTAFNSTSGNYTMTPNPAYSGPHASTVDSFSVIDYSSEPAEMNALKAGAVDIGYVPTDNIPDAKSLSSTYNIFGYPENGFRYVYYNFDDTTGDFNNIIDKLYIREALAHLVNDTGIIDAYLHGGGSASYGVMGKFPASPFTPSNADSALYPFSVTAAENLLKDNGWSVTPGGTDTCLKPGTGAGECGAGIPKGTPLAWNLVYFTGVELTSETDTYLASEAKSIGIEITLRGASFNAIIQNNNDVASPKTENQWAMADFGADGDNFYPTTLGLFNTTGSSNFGGYNNPTLNSLINASVTSSNPDAVLNELSYLDIEQPILVWPKADWAEAPGLMAISKQVSGPPNYFLSFTQGLFQAEFWYLKK
jgi:peptide/nickel transport system substrate-binding protein